MVQSDSLVNVPMSLLSAYCNLCLSKAVAVVALWLCLRNSTKLNY